MPAIEAVGAGHARDEAAGGPGTAIAAMGRSYSTKPGSRRRAIPSGG